MKTTITILMIAALFSQILAAPFRFDMPSTAVRSDDEAADDDADTPFCRLFKGPSRCVDEPLPLLDNTPWCPYRMCGPSYVPADLCPADPDLQATDKCKVEELSRDVYKCDDSDFGYNYVPVGCTPGTSGCKEVPTCSCVLVEDYKSTVLTWVTTFTPDCSKGRPASGTQ